MIIKNIYIKKFRGFNEVSISLGSQLTIIAGLNGTQKTTLLGLITQPFTISGDDNRLKEERPLCGGTYKSAFNEKFKLSENFDKPKEHEWTINLTGNNEPFTIESMARDTSNIRFWKKGDRTKGAGYIQLPVIFLSLKRVLPIGEDNKISRSDRNELTQEEAKFFTEWYNKILISSDVILSTNHLESPDKSTRGINTEFYDWQQNSAGQDNIGKILLAILSFKRLKEKYPDEYKGGILAIDEIDATLYPGSQIRLLEALRTFSSRLKIQIICTTHSLSILKRATELINETSTKKETENQIRTLFLEKRNNKIEIAADISYRSIKNRLHVAIERIKSIKIYAFTEDREGIAFTKALLKGKKNLLSFVDSNFSCSNLINLASQKIPTFCYPESVIFLDGDVKQNAREIRRVNSLKNIVLLPGNKSPERLLADFLFNLDDNSPIWKSINEDFNKLYCFKDHSYDNIMSTREIAKAWFNFHLKDWGINATKIVTPWAKENKDAVTEFIDNFIKVYNSIAKENGIKYITI